MQLVFCAESRGLNCQNFHQSVAVLSAGVGCVAPEITAPAPGGQVRCADRAQVIDGDHLRMSIVISAAGAYRLFCELLKQNFRVACSSPAMVFP